MAATYITNTAAAVAFANTTTLMYILNLHATKLVKVYRIWAKQTFVGTAYSGGLNVLQINLASGYTSGGTALAANKCDSRSTTITVGTDVRLLKATGITGVTQGATLRQIMMVGDELTAKTTVIGEVLWSIHPLSLIWDSGYGDSNIQPITLRQNEGLTVYNLSTTGAGGGIDLIAEFTFA